MSASYIGLVGLMGVIIIFPMRGFAQMKKGSTDTSSAAERSLSLERETKLCEAARVGNEEEVRQLIAAQVNVNARNQRGETPLHLAAEQGHEEIVRFLLNARANVCATNAMGNTPLHYVAARGHLTLPTTQELLTMQAQEQLALIEQQKRLAIIEQLITAGANVNARNRMGGTPLHYAAQMGDEVAVEHLIAWGAAVNIVDNVQENALHYAAQEGNETIVRRLIEAGADFTATNERDETPLHYAMQSEHEAIIRLLIERLLETGPERINDLDAVGETLLHYAAHRGLTKAVELLLAAGANVNAVDNLLSRP